ncbi:hypothetical protein ACEQ8H_001924 [Pleosporales sp. CAS-2024a]
MSHKETATAELQTRAYDALSSYLEAHHKHIVEVEILPPAFRPPDGLFLEHGRSLGIPNKIFALAFVEARKIFFESAKNEDDPTPALQATRVMLLYEPEHLTAANFRKRWLISLKADTETDSTSGAQTIYRKALKHEYCFLDTVLTSPLHRQSKSPTLWHHRLWLFELFRPSILELVPEEVRADFWRAELKSVCKSGEKHAHNFYAWQYARRIVERIDGMDATIEVAQTVKTWCCQHPSDTSGWSCLLYLLPKVQPLARRTVVVREVLNYALKLQLQHESLWVFIRTIVAHETLKENRDELFATLKEYSQEIKDRSTVLHERVEQALNWIKRYGNIHHKLGTSLA